MNWITVSINVLLLGSATVKEPLKQSAPREAVEAIEASWREVARNAVWRSPTLVEREALRESVRLIVENLEKCDNTVSSPALQQLLSKAGYEAWVETLQEAKLVFVRERLPGIGGGLFVFRCGSSAPVILQAPHAFYDAKTGGIVRRLFVEGSARGAFWNTVHRYKSRPDETEADPVHPADVAHQFGSLFHSATIGCALASGDRLRFVQIHGFQEGVVPFDLVISTGDEARLATRVAHGLQSAFKRVALYGKDTSQFGATTNVQRVALEETQPGRFLHLEFVPSARAHILESKETRATLTKVLEEAWW